MSSDADSGGGGGNPDDRLKSLRNAVDHLEAGICSLIDFILPATIASDAYEIGIPTETLEQLIDIITKPNHLDQATITTLIKNLYALEKIPSIIVTKIVGCLGPSKSKPSPATQALLLRWLLLVYDCLEDQSHLSKLYAVLFNNLDMISLRRPLCHLLSLITRRKHVKPFRIQALMELLRNVGDDERELMGFLRVFKNYYPDIIVGDVGRSRKASFFFKHPDPEWSAHLKELQDRNRERVMSSTTSTTFQVVRRGGVKRSKVESVIPDVQTSRVQPSHTSLEELRNVTDFVENLEKIELPNQMVSVLGDRLAQKYMLLVGPKIAKLRLEDWLETFLKDEFERANLAESDEPEALGYVLSVATEYVRSTKQLPGAIQSFIKAYLRSWNGRDNRSQILNLLEFLPKGPYEDLRREFLEPLENAILDHTPSSRTALLDFYFSLIRQWGVSLRTEESAPGAAGFTPLISLITHAELLCLSVLEVPFTTYDRDTKPPKPISTSILQLYTGLANLYSHAADNGNIRLTIPLAPTVYHLAFTSSLAQISLLCAVLATYKSSFEESLASQTLQSPKPGGALYPTQMVGQFNGYIMDLCNLVWRNRGLNSEDPNALGCLLPAPTIAALTEYINDSNETMRRRKRPEGPAFHYTLPTMFSLSHHVALADHSAACFADFEDQQVTKEDQARLRRPVTQKALTALEKEGGVKVSWQEYRLKMLDWFDDRGSLGIGKLMRSTMKALRKET
ncbi:Mis6 domain protein [Rasamsonia emersonii CBS 393.64]|uniref:Mis6 domain protein n=1 Tax=Rasamsonia emersonii (strain ATCC 16479 / CBS 393.64 / IMI 116815) TaxID=1408163 RepID=A0A0F4Z4X8_RASE3|nr:Mis6 domain protein [Rasamsonia emersonii CBS 393.64]KKA25385.1 Mis6 domain protein [Rasamsonia emersonii CBS 393.64]